MNQKTLDEYRGKQQRWYAAYVEAHRKYEAITKIVEGMEVLLEDESAVPPPAVAENGVNGPYATMTIPEAIKSFLDDAGRPQKIDAIADALRSGGIQESVEESLHVRLFYPDSALQEPGEQAGAGRRRPLAARRKRRRRNPGDDPQLKKGGHMKNAALVVALAVAAPVLTGCGEPDAVILKESVFEPGVWYEVGRVTGYGDRNLSVCLDEYAPALSARAASFAAGDPAQFSLRCGERQVIDQVQEWFLRIWPGMDRLITVMILALVWRNRNRDHEHQ